MGVGSWELGGGEAGGSPSPVGMASVGTIMGRPHVFRKRKGGRGGVLDRLYPSFSINQVIIAFFLPVDKQKPLKTLQ